MAFAVSVDLSSALVWPTDELFNINSNINIILEGQWKESGLCQKHTYRDMFMRLHYGYGYGRHIGNATASLKSAYVYYVYDHQRHLLTTTSLQIGIFPQLLCYSVYSKGAVLHFVCCMCVIRSSHNATFQSSNVDS